MVGAWLLFSFVGVLVAVLRSVCDNEVYQNRSKRRLNDRVTAVVVETGSDAWDNFGPRVEAVTLGFIAISAAITKRKHWQRRGSFQHQISTRGRVKER